MAYLDDDDELLGLDPWNRTTRKLVQSKILRGGGAQHNNPLLTPTGDNVPRQPIAASGVLKSIPLRLQRERPV